MLDGAVVPSPRQRMKHSAPHLARLVLPDRPAFQETARCSNCDNDVFDGVRFYRVRRRREKWATPFDRGTHLDACVSCVVQVAARETRPLS